MISRFIDMVVMLTIVLGSLGIFAIVSVIKIGSGLLPGLAEG